MTTKTKKEPLKHSLAAAKKKPVPKFKNVLAQPFPRYWPEINATDCEELQQIISITLTAEVNNKSTPQELGVSLGTASSLRLLKRGEASCLLLSTEIKPKFIITQIINWIISKNNDTVVLCVPQLKKITGELFKIPTLAVTVIKGRNLKLETWIREKSKMFPIPEKLLTYYQQTEESKTSDTSHLKNITTTADSVMESEKSTTQVEIDFNKLYLTRTSNDCRAFIPDNIKNIESSQKVWSDYISFSDTKSSMKMEIDDDDDDDDKEERSEMKNKKSYIKQQANRIQSDQINTINNNSTNGSLKNKKNIKHKKNKDTSNDNKYKINYISLKVNKIQKNPEKKKKKKNKGISTITK